MDSVRTFKSFQKISHSTRGRRLQRVSSLDSRNSHRESDSRPVMRHRDLSEKPSLDRDEILKKLQDSKKGKFIPSGKKTAPKSTDDSKNSKGEGKQVSEATTPSDVGLNDPNDPMTSEKLKSVLQAGGVNFSGKEKEILSKILNG